MFNTELHFITGVYWQTSTQSICATVHNTGTSSMAVHLADLTCLTQSCLLEVLAGTEIPGGGGSGRRYLTLHCHHQNDSCIKNSSDESHLNVSLIVRDKVIIKTTSTDHNSSRERRAEAESH